jgi:hypothetical protein
MSAEDPSLGNCLPVAAAYSQVSGDGRDYEG